MDAFGHRGIGIVGPPLGIRCVTALGRARSLDTGSAVN
jgi:hypothetical protein